MSKNLKVVDENTGELLENIDFNGGYNIQYTKNEGSIAHIKHLDNARFGEKYWIKNGFYQPIARKLARKFEEIGFINEERILFLEDEYWEPPKNSAKKQWISKTVKANTQLAEFAGYDFIIFTKKYFMDKMSEEQVILLIYHELKHIDKYGGLKEHDVEDWDNIIATFGTKWAETKDTIDNILSEDFEGWEHLRQVKGRQVNMFDNVTPIKIAQGK